VLAIDFEASCLPRHGRSFPIEVGIADASGWSRSWLIRPAPEWAGWTWTDEAEALHGITRAELALHGLPADAVMRELNAAIGSRDICADHDLDAQWLALLEAAAGVPASFRLRQASELFGRIRPDSAAIQQALLDADRSVSRRHRAGPDSLWLATLAHALHVPDEAGAGKLAA
jgi:hypothetical protein